jgi:hypothetical protein
MIKGLRVPQGNPRGRWACSTDIVAIRRCLVLGEGEDDLSKVPIDCNFNEASPSGTANDIV